MDLFEINKIIGAVLFSVLVILGISIVSASIFDVPSPAQPGYVIAGAEEPMEEETVVVETEQAEPAEAEAAQASTEPAEEPAESAAAEPAAEGEASGQAPEGEQQAAAEPAAEASSGAGDSALLQRIAGGDAEKGKKVARKCAACHTFDEGGKNRVGPNLHGVVGREVASVPDFSYSAALKELGGTWSYERLDEWVHNPKELVAKTSMAFAGVKKEDDRADLIAYMRSLSPNAPPLP
jgi:cytochrome c